MHLTPSFILKTCRWWMTLSSLKKPWAPNNKGSVLEDVVINSLDILQSVKSIFPRSRESNMGTDSPDLDIQFQGFNLLQTHTSCVPWKTTVNCKISSPPSPQTVRNSGDSKGKMERFCQIISTLFSEVFREAEVEILNLSLWSSPSAIKDMHLESLLHIKKKSTCYSTGLHDPFWSRHYPYPDETGKGINKAPC